MLKETSILDLIGLDSDNFIVEPIIDDQENLIEIFITLNDEERRKCPHCKGARVKIKDWKQQRIKYSIIRTKLKPIFLVVNKRRFVCKDCKKSFVQQHKLCAKRRRISSDIEKYIYLRTMEPISFTSIARELQLSEPTVRTIFNDIVKAGRKPLTMSISIDEKHFVTDLGKYVCVISDPFNGVFLDIVPSRKMGVLDEYFRSIKLEERQKVKFITTDMFEGYRSIIKKFFPNAIHIIDHFHVTKLFTETIQILRKRYMKDLNPNSRKYRFIKKNWRYFLLSPYKRQDLLEKIYYDQRTGEIMDIKEKVRRIANDFPPLFEICGIYDDYCHYLQIGLSDEECQQHLEFIINKCLGSTTREIVRIGETLLNFSEEILNYFLSKNSYKLSNAVAESLNNKIGKFISCSYGLKNFITFRKRILHSNEKRGV